MEEWRKARLGAWEEMGGISQVPVGQSLLVGRIEEAPKQAKAGPGLPAQPGVCRGAEPGGGGLECQKELDMGGKLRH